MQEMNKMIKEVVNFRSRQGRPEGYHPSEIMNHFNVFYLLNNVHHTTLLTRVTC